MKINSATPITISHAPFQLVDFHALGAALGDAGVGIGRLHGRGEVAQIHLGGQPGDVVFGVELVHVLAQVAQAHAVIRLRWSS